MIKEIQNYFDKILVPQLTRIGASDTYITQTLDLIYKQMYSVLINWDEPNFINTLFLTVSEEAPFYEPEAKAETKSFVVLTIRNSPIESLQSDLFHNAGLDKKINDEQLKEITSTAIEYFDKLNLPALAADEEYVLEDDVYYVLSEEYPIAWNVLKSVASSPLQSSRFEGFVYETTPEELVLEKISRKTNKMRSSVVDGYEPSLDTDLISWLNYIIEGKGSFAIDCFKMLSRNMKKVLLVIEILMQNQCRFVTTNYFIENGYYEKRIPILRAASSANWSAGMKEHYHNHTGVLEKHKRHLQATFDD